MESEVNQKIRKLYQWKFYKAEEESTIYKSHKKCVSKTQKSPQPGTHFMSKPPCNPHPTRWKKYPGVYS